MGSRLRGAQPVEQSDEHDEQDGAAADQEYFGPVEPDLQDRQDKHGKPGDQRRGSADLAAPGRHRDHEDRHRADEGDAESRQPRATEANKRTGDRDRHQEGCRREQGEGDVAEPEVATPDDGVEAEKGCKLQP